MIINSNRKIFFVICVSRAEYSLFFKLAGNVSSIAEMRAKNGLKVQFRPSEASAFSMK